MRDIIDTLDRPRLRVLILDQRDTLRRLLDMPIPVTWEPHFDLDLGSAPVEVMKTTAYWFAERIYWQLTATF